MSDSPATRQRLLIVDDSKVIRVTARKILRNHFETVEAVDGEDAWEILTTQEAFALMVSDLTMPNLDGYGLLGRIRNSPLPHISELPVIIITGANDSEGTMKRAREAGATDFIGKPFDSVLLLARTQSHANAHAVTNTLKQEVSTLEEHAAVDALTELANEISFMERGYQQLSYAIRHSSSLAVYRLEIDDYGKLFQEYGEAFTESVIQATANIIGSAIRQEDTAARIGTARFALLSPGVNRTGVRNLAERIRRDINTRIFKHGHSVVRVSISIGVAAPVIRRNTRLDELISLADRRLLRAINRGGNQVVYEGNGPAPAREPVFEGAGVPALEETATAFPVAEQPGPGAAFSSLAFDTSDDIEEIELFSPVESQETGHAGNTTGIEAFADSPPGLPDTFAGPVPDDNFTGSAPAPVNAGSIHDAEIPTLSIAISTDAPNAGTAVDWFEEAGEDTTEEHGTSMALYPMDPPDLQETSFDAGSRDEPVPGAAAAGIDRSQWQLPVETVEPPAPAVQRGIIARILVAVGALLGLTS